MQCTYTEYLLYIDCISQIIKKILHFLIHKRLFESIVAQNIFFL